MPYLSAVIPVYNEEESLSELHRQVMSVCHANGYEYEIIFIDDIRTILLTVRENEWSSG